MNDRSEVSTAPMLLLISTLVLPEMVIGAVKVMLLTTLIWALVLMAFERSENLLTS